MYTVEICESDFSIFVFNKEKFEKTNEIHVDLVIISALFQFLLSTNTEDYVVESLNVLVENLSTEFDK
jgi:hypothetical protein